jgi:hypothetical protein
MAGKEEALTDGRRRRWIPLSVEFPFDKTGTRLQEEFGAAGIGVWVAMLTAAKRSHVQGTFSYTTEEEAWINLGITTPPFPLDEFLRVTGQLKKTRRRRRGRITDVQITAWEEWNDAPRTGSGRSQKSWSQDDSARQDRASERDSDTESEREIEIDESNPFFKFLRKKGLLDE